MVLRLIAPLFLGICGFLFVPSLAGAKEIPLGCNPMPVAVADNIGKPLNLDLIKKRLLAYRCTSYDAEIEKVLESASNWVKRRAPEVVQSGKVPAIVLDIDETSLSNWRQIFRDGFAYIASGTCDLKNDAALCGEESWQRSG